MTLDKIRTGRGRKLRREPLQETALPIPYDAAAMPGATVLGTDGLTYSAQKVNNVYRWVRTFGGLIRPLTFPVADGLGTITPELHIEMANSTSACISVLSNASSGNIPGRVFLSMTRSGEVLGSTLVQVGDIVGTVGFCGSDGVNIVQSAAISASVEGVPGVGDVPLRLRLRTREQGSSAAAQARLTINSAGNVLINNTTGTERLSVTGNIQLTNTADSYKVGTNNVVGSRKVGWAAPTGTATRTTFDSTTVTTAQLAERLKALIDDLTSHGLIGA